MADDTSTTPMFQIQRMYLKDLSLEQPNSPQILLEQGQPQVEINLTLGAEPIADGMYEVTVTATVTTKVNDKTLFLVEAKQGGIFEIRNIPEEQLQQILGIACPNIVYPYLRAIVSDVCTRAGFPPVVLSEVNFQAMYEAQQAQANAQSAAPRATARASPAPSTDGRRSRAIPAAGEAAMNVTVLGAGAWGTALAVHAAARPSDAAVGARCRAGRAAALGAPQRALPAGDRAAAGAAGRRRPRRGAAPRRRRCRRHRDADGRPRAAARAPAARSSTRPCCGCARASRSRPARSATRSRARCSRRRASACSPGRASRSRSRAASRPRSSPRAATPASAPPPSPPSTTPSLRIYTSADPVGVEVGGAVKNVLAIATGIADGMGLGLNARAALVTRGLAEMTRLGVALGADAPTPSWACPGSATWCSPRPATCRATARSASCSRGGKALADDPRRPRPRRRGRSQRADGAARAPPRAASRCRSSPPSSTCWPAASGPSDALEQLMRREARPESLRRRLRTAPA